MGAVLLDIGGTILTRSKPGPKQRIINVLCRGMGLTQKQALIAADVTLTSETRALAIDRLTEEFRLSPDLARAVADALNEEEGDPCYLPGALDFVERCRLMGLRIVYTTNAVLWAPPLPPEFLEGALYVSSSSIGISKRKRDFWKIVLLKYGLEAGACLSIGDSLANDIRPAQRVGIAGLLAGKRDWSFETYSDLLNGLLDKPVQSDGFVVGPVEVVSDYHVVECGHLAGYVEAKTRTRAVLRVKGERIWGEIVRAKDNRKALFVTENTVPDPVFGWIAVDPDRRITHVPTSIERMALERGRTFDGLPSHVRRHYLSLLLEAANDEILTERLELMIDLLPLVSALDLSADLRGPRQT
jgi:FMN phosphatase YigB (HAD superfamily)